jgi:hypothetical protein
MRASKERGRETERDGERRRATERDGERRSETPPYLARASAWCLGSRRRRLCAGGPSRPPPGSPSLLRGPRRSRTCGSCSGAGRRRRRAACSSSCSLSRAPWSSRWRRRCWPCICTDGSSPRSTHRRSRAAPHTSGVCVLLLQDLLQSCARGGRRRVEDCFSVTFLMPNKGHHHTAIITREEHA